MVKILLVGNGNMASEYAKVLREGYSISYDVAGRNQAKLDSFVQEKRAAQSFLWQNITVSQLSAYSAVIIAVNIENVSTVLEEALNKGAKKILVEKPAALRSSRHEELMKLAEAKGAEVKIAVNRRFYAPILHLKKTLEQEPASSCFFDFTEWAWRVESLSYPREVLEKWSAGNPIHVIDTVHFLFGPLKVRSAFVAGKGEITWHPSGAIFNGLLDGKVPVTYATNWTAPGRWLIDVCTAEAKYRLAPMEKLQQIKKKTVDPVEVPLDYEIDKRFKPGLFRMVGSFLGRDEETRGFLPDLKEGLAVMKLIETISGYEP